MSRTWAWRKEGVSRLALPLAIVGALIVSALIVLMFGINPLRAGEAIVVGAFGSGRALTETVLMATPLMLIGLGLVLAFRCKVWNIGAEGQYLMGAAASTWIGLNWGDTVPSIIILPAMLVAGGLAGALWGALVGVLKAKRGLSDVVVSLMLNYVAIFGFSYLVRVPMHTPLMSLPQTALLPEAARLPTLFGTRIHVGVILALLAAVLVHVVLWRTTLGYELRAVGANEEAAEAAGIRSGRSVVLVMALSGMLAGWAGMIHVSGVEYYLSYGTPAGLGYTAILVVILGQLQPGGVVASSFLFAGLVVGVDAMHRAVGLPQSLVGVVEAIIVFFYLIGNALRRQQE